MRQIKACLQLMKESLDSAKQREGQKKEFRHFI